MQEHEKRKKYCLKESCDSKVFGTIWDIVPVLIFGIMAFAGGFVLGTYV